MISTVMGYIHGHIPWNTLQFEQTSITRAKLYACL